MKTFLAITASLMMLSGCSSIMFCKNLPTVHNEDSTNFSISKPFTCE